jgi:hypothetical protein
MIDKAVNDIRKPLTDFNRQREARLWQAAKDKDWKDWATNIRLPANCTNPRTEIRKLECKNQWDSQVENFERTWATKVRKGWKPDGVF